MKRIALAAALVLSSAVSGAALAASHDPAEDSASISADARDAAASDEGGERGMRTAEGFFDRFRGGGEDGERRHGRNRHHWDDDDDDDDDGDSASARRSPRVADPNSATAPVPDTGVFNGKARPKVEVQ